MQYQEFLARRRELMAKDIADAVADLSRPEEIGRAFFGFQKFLYLQEAAA
jgi:hypothetical protein